MSGFDSAKRRRIIVDDEDDEDEVVSNPDEIQEDFEQEEEEEGEDLADTWQHDYAPAPELDYYEAEDLDDTEYLEDWEFQQAYRRSAEEELAIRDEFENSDLPTDNKGRNVEEEDSDDEEEEDKEKHLNLEAFECPLREWIAQERTRREIERRFRDFLKTFYVGIDEVKRFRKRHGKIELPPHLKEHPPMYPRKIRAMCAANNASLEVSYGHIAEAESLLAIWLTDVPKEILSIFDEVFKSEVLNVFPDYSSIAKDLKIRIVNLPLSDRLRDLRQGDLNNLIRVNGVVTRRTGIFPQEVAKAWMCGNRDGFVLRPDPNGSNHKLSNRPPPYPCPRCGGTNWIVYPEASLYRNYQKITLQESPGSVPAGRVPRYKDVILVGDLIDVARPGEEIEVTGIYNYNALGKSQGRSGFPVFSTTIDANCIQKRSGSSNTGLSDEDKRIIKELSTDPRIGERIVRSIAPSIYGYKHIKQAVALSLFGGCAKQGGTGGTHRVRGDINILLLGDPGTAKSQILKYAEKIAPRAIYTTGKGASAVGLTAGVHKDPLTKEWTLEGGALVLADQGVCLIDEFDKMNEQDRTSIHEAMEQQTISVSKAGIVTSLQARCAVLAAANPIGGRYDPSLPFSDNVELTDPILQRFDVLCVLQDIVDPIVDEKLANFVVNSHFKSHPDGLVDEDDDVDDGNSEQAAGAVGGGVEEFDEGPEQLSQEILKKYITYAKAYVKPILHVVDSEKVASLYADLRRQSAISGGVPIAVRHIESVMRMAEASARMHLRDHVREDDIDVAIKVMLQSFLQAQKVSVRNVLKRSFRKYVTHGEDSNQLLMHQLQGLILDAEKYKKLRHSKATDSTEVYMHELENKAKELNIYDLRSFYASTIFKSHGLTADLENRLIIKTYLFI